MPVSMGDVSFNAGTTVHLNAGIYEINSLTLRGGAQIVIDSGPVIIKVAGQGQTTPIDLSGGGVSNPSLDPTQLQFVYGGSGNIKIDRRVPNVGPRLRAQCHDLADRRRGLLWLHLDRQVGGGDRRLQHQLRPAFAELRVDRRQPDDDVLQLANVLASAREPTGRKRAPAKNRTEHACPCLTGATACRRSLDAVAEGRNFRRSSATQGAIVRRPVIRCTTNKTSATTNST